MIAPASIYYEHCEPGWHVPESVAQHAILLLVTQGTLTYHIDGHTVFLAKGDLLHIPRGAVRAASHASGQAHDMYVAHYHYEGDGDGLDVLRNSKLLHQRLYQFDYMKQRFSLLAQHWLRRSDHVAVFCHSILLEMLAILEEEARSGASQDKSFRIVSEVQHYIASNYRRTLPMAEIAALVDRTPNYVSHLFKEATGQTITAYTQQIRIAAACDLLANSQMNVGEISDFLGFCEQSYFNKVFKRLTGTLPSAYMKEKTKVWK
ncbi:helix-turn-helix domain-containing protein [Paenibacillus sp. 1P07SE]|uniref:helix-turn-helix domain-containing protein n=1 Tax=Paenibacillus sp. 1P07SE TaxID=3132209 RepID=UPI0039A48491